MRARSIGFPVAGVAALLTLGACTSEPEPAPPSPSAPVSAATPAALTRFYEQDLTWESCGGPYECTEVTVPADYDRPRGETITLAMTRRPAENPRGSLLVNPGGPGGSGVRFARGISFSLSPEVAEAFDVVGFDPRGVADSTPVDCLSDTQVDDYLNADGTPDSAAEVAEVADAAAALGEGCLTRTPAVAAHMDTESAARDMDIVRAVLGDEKLNLIGKSYGSFLGAQHAELFPDRVGRLVLDGVLPSSLNSDELTLGQAKAFEVGLRRFVEYCDTQSDCPLPGGVDEGVARIQEFLASLEDQPLPGIGDRPLTESLATYAVLSYLYFPIRDWQDLAFGLEEAFAGDGSVLVDMVDERTERNSDGSYVDNGNEAFYAVSCLDRPAVGGVAHAQELAGQWADDAPTFGRYMAWGNLVCWQWPMGPGTADAAGEPPVFTAPGSDPILVVSTRYDTATPYEWGVQVAEELDNAALLTFEGDRHTGYLSGSQCIDRAVDDYLLNGTLPAEGTSCAPDPVDPPD